MDDSAYLLQCIDCGTGFTSPTGGQRGRPRKRCTACSPVQRGMPSTYKPVHTVRRTCGNPECAREFSATRGSLAKFCDAPCRNRVRNVAAQIDRRDRSERPCAWCATPFAPAYGDGRRRFCSNACRKADRYKRSTGSTNRRRAKRLGVEYDDFDKRQVFERDGWRCQICGVPTPEKYSGTLRPDAPQLDHIVAISNGGPHTMSNTQCACRRCNAKKRAGPPAGQIGLFTALLNAELQSKRRRAQHASI